MSTSSTVVVKGTHHTVTVVKTRDGKELEYGTCVVDNKLLEVARMKGAYIWFYVRSLERVY